MKVVFFGNVCNFAYWFAKWGRELGFDTHALIEGDNLFPRDVPSWEDPSYDPANPPPWVHFYRAGTAGQRLLRGAADHTLARTLQQFESIHSLSPAAAIAADVVGFAGVHHTVGSFAVTSSWFRHVDMRTRLMPRRIPTVLRFRRAMRKASAIVVSTPIEHFEVTASPYRARMIALPIAYDTAPAKRYLARNSSSSDGGAKRTFLLPARQHWSLKGNDTFLKALARLSPRELGRCQVEIADWGVDRERTRSLVSELRLDSITRFRPLMTKSEMWEAFARPGVIVLDQVPHLNLHGGGIGGVARDAMAVGAVVVTHAAPAMQRSIFRSAPPILHTDCSESAVFDKVRESLDLTDPQMRAIATAAREWMHQECDFSQVIPRYLDLH